MASRREWMDAAGVYACPSWCVQDDDETARRTHLGLWMDVITNGGPDGSLTVQARPIRCWPDWSRLESEADVDWAVEVAHTLTSDGVPWQLGQRELAAWNDGMAYLERLAAEPDEWVEAYPGANEDQAVDAADAAAEVTWDEWLKEAS